MKTYTYTGPTQSLSLATGKTKDKEDVERSTFTDFAFVEGHDVDLPEGNTVVKNMIEAGLLRPSDKVPAAKPGKTTEGNK